MYGLIYALIDPRDRALRYIGQTTVRLDRRVSAHVSAPSLRVHSHLGRWMGGLVRSGDRPIAIPIARASSREELDALEIAFIAYLRSAGAKLVNTTDGGGGTRGRIVPQEQRDRIAAKQRGVARTPHTERWKIDQSLAKRGKPSSNTPEHHARIGDMKRGVPRTPEERAAISAGRKGKGKGPRPDVSIQMSKLWTGRKRPDRVGDKHPKFRADVSTDEIVRLRRDGKSQRAIARALGVNQIMVQRRLRAAGVP